MVWQRLCGINEVPAGSAVLMKVADREVLLLHTESQYIAMPPFCARMRGPMKEGTLERCLEGGAPTCNRASSEGDKVGQRGATSAPLMGYGVRLDEQAIYVDLGRTAAIEGYEHVTCAPEIRSAQAGDLVINLWAEGFSNEKLTFRRSATITSSQSGSR